MHNHVMYYFDEDGEIELTQCHFCKFFNIGEGKTACRKGDVRSAVDCSLYTPIGREETRKRIADIRESRPRR